MTEHDADLPAPAPLPPADPAELRAYLTRRLRGHRMIGTLPDDEVRWIVAHAAPGDVRAGAINRVASAVGEGAMAVRLVHEYLALT